jgi:hypothetical protein
MSMLFRVFPAQKSPACPTFFAGLSNAHFLNSEVAMQTLHVASKQSSGAAPFSPTQMRSALCARMTHALSDECREKIFTFLQARDEIMRVSFPSLQHALKPAGSTHVCAVCCVPW